METRIASSMGTLGAATHVSQPRIAALPQSSAARLPAASLWSSLCEGRLRFADQRRDSLRNLLVFVEREATQVRRSALKPRRRQILEMILSGLSENTIGIELDVAASTVCAEFRRAMESFGLSTRLSALPVTLPQLRHLALSGESIESSSGWFEESVPACTTIALPRLDLALAERLSPAELDVCRRLLDGSTHEAIALERRTSVRTTANQLATVFAKLKVSGRLQLLAALAAGKFQGPPAPIPVRLAPRDIHAEPRDLDSGSECGLDSRAAVRLVGGARVA